MSAAGSHPVSAPAAFDGPAAMGHLLHALNQPLTGLQCSLELATAGPRSTEQYLRTLRDGLALTARMRVLVEALRELADVERGQKEAVTLVLDAAVENVMSQFLPVADANGVRLHIDIRQTGLQVSSPPGLSNLLFRLGDAILSLARPGEFRIIVSRQNDQACVFLHWTAGPAPEQSPFSRAELGFLIAQAGFQKAGWDCRLARQGDNHTCTVLTPLVSSASSQCAGRTERAVRGDFA